MIHRLCYLGCVVLVALHNFVRAAFDADDIGKYRDETFVELPYVYRGYLDSPLTPEVTIKILVNPCSEYDAGCCDNRYGVMEYFPQYDGGGEYQVDRTCLFEGRTYPIECVTDHNGNLMSYQDLRVSDYDLFIDEHCVAR